MAKMTGFKVYKGTKQAFIDSGKAAANADAIVFITGGSDAKGSCIYAQGVYFANFAEFLAAIKYVKGINVGDRSYNAAQGGGYIVFKSIDPATVAINADENGIKIGLSETFVNQVNNTATALGAATDTANKDGSAFARIAALEAIDHGQLAADASAAAVATILDGAPEAFDTLKEVADWIANNDHAQDVAGLVTDVANLKKIDHAYKDADAKVLEDANAYADGLAGNYATAAQGAKADTAYQKPADGIGTSDLSAAVNASLAKADAAITAEDLTNYYTKTEVDNMWTWEEL